MPGGGSKPYIQAEFGLGMKYVVVIIKTDIKALKEALRYYISKSLRWWGCKFYVIAWKYVRLGFSPPQEFLWRTNISRNFSSRDRNHSTWKNYSQEIFCLMWTHKQSKYQLFQEATENITWKLTRFSLCEQCTFITTTSGTSNWLRKAAITDCQRYSRTVIFAI